MNFSNLKQLKSISKNLKEIKRNIKKYIKRQDILDFIEKCFKQEYVNFEVNKYSCTFYQNGNGDTFYINSVPSFGKIIVSLTNETELEEYQIDFDHDITTIKHILKSKWKYTSLEKIYEYHNDILVREIEKVIDNETNNSTIEKEAIYDAVMKMLMRKRREFIINMNEPNKPKEIHYEATSFIEGINIDSKKNSTENYSYLNLHLPCVETKEQSYLMATERLENNGVVKTKVKVPPTNGDKNE